MLIFLQRTCGFANALLQISALSSSNLLNRTILIGYDDVFNSNILDIHDKPLISFKTDSLYARIIFFFARNLLLSRNFPESFLLPYYLTDFYGQDSRFFSLSYLRSLIRIKNKWSSSSKSIFSQLQIDFDKSVIIHLRGGDYKNWPSKFFPAILPSVYFNTAIKLFPPDYTYYIITNDTEYLRSLDLEFKYHHLDLSSSLEFTVFSFATNIVLSASTFSLVAAHLYASNELQKTVIAPNRWGGWPTNSWYPKFFSFPSVKYIDF